MSDAFELVEPLFVPPLDPEFRPAVLANKALVAAAQDAGQAVPLRIGLERADGSISTFETVCWAEGSEQFEANYMYAERLVKFLLWQRGGWRVMVGGPAAIGQYIKQVYAKDGARAFDWDFMGGVYEHEFTVDVMAASDVPDTREETRPLGRHLDGCRIGIDLGGSDYKLAAVVNGEPVWADEFPWDPKGQTDPGYHRARINEGLRIAASKMPRVDAIGGSAAGVWINNRVLVASLFRGIPRDVFDREVKDLFVNIGKEWGVPLTIVNDGEVTALAGSMELNANAVLGIAMGTSEAAGYVTPEGNITGWLNELAFAPIDYAPSAPADEWSGDIGCGVQYFNQTGVVRAAEAAGIEFEAGLGLPEKLVVVQDLMKAGDERVIPVYETVGTWFGYALAHYADFYEIQHCLILGRATTGEGGVIIQQQARKVLEGEFPDLAAKIQLHLPDESSRRVGQSVAAASLPEIESKGCGCCGQA
ncbi:MAG: ROK family protein [Armatimonadetes bacterium]|nr:ROK family protein [Armatimonadota bacterium]